MEKGKVKFDPREFIHTRLVLDASVLMKIFLEEAGSVEVDQLFRLARQKELTILCPPLITFEVLNVLAKSGKTVEDVNAMFQRFKALDIAVIQPDDRFVAEALADATSNKAVSYYDASYHALAKDLEATFVTADRKYYELMKGKGGVKFFEV